MDNPLTRKLETYVVLGDDDRRLLDKVIMGSKTYSAKKDIISQDDRPENVHLILSGLACRYKVIERGERQIFAFLIKGDFCDLHVALLNRMDHSIAALTKCQVVDIPRKTILDLLENHAVIAKGLLMASLVDEAVPREWVVNVGRRPAEQRIAHLFCEIHARKTAIGAAEKGEVNLPITQVELADTVGLSAVHVNRCLMALRERGVIEFDRGVLRVLDIPRLQAIAGFDESYLHLLPGFGTVNGHGGLTVGGRHLDG